MRLFSQTPRVQGNDGGLTSRIVQRKTAVARLRKDQIREGRSAAVGKYFDRASIQQDVQLDDPVPRRKRGLVLRPKLGMNRRHTGARAVDVYYPLARVVADP